MGSSYSKAEKEEDSRVFDTKLIHFDEDGNLRLGTKEYNREGELKRIMDADDPVEEDGKIWYIINSAWVQAWLLYVHSNKNINPNPGPCRNDCLLTPAEDNSIWVPKENLIMGRKEIPGDYRRISKECWEIYCELYPGSGPAIYVEFYEDLKCKPTGLYDTSTWVVDQSKLEKQPGKKKKPKPSEIIVPESKLDNDCNNESKGEINYTIVDVNVSDNTRLSMQQFFGNNSSFSASSTMNPIVTSEALSTESRATSVTSSSKVARTNEESDWLFKENQHVEM